MNEMSEEQRKEERRKLKRYLRVYESENGPFLGHLMNISAGGLQLVSEMPLDLNKDMVIWVEMVSEKIRLKVKSIWCSEDTLIESYNTGFQITEMTSDTETKVRMLLDILKQPV